MKRVAIDEAKDKMILAEPAADRNGRILMGKGETLDAKIIAKLKSLGVRTLAVVDEQPSAARDEQPAQPDDLERESIRTKINKRFQRFPSHPIMTRLKEMAQKILLNELRH